MLKQSKVKVPISCFFSSLLKNYNNLSEYKVDSNYYSSNEKTTKYLNCLLWKGNMAIKN